MASNKQLDQKFHKSFEVAEQLISKDQDRETDDIQKLLGYYHKLVKLSEDIRKRELARSLYSHISAEVAFVFVKLIQMGITQSDFSQYLTSNGMLMTELFMQPSDALKWESLDRVRTSDEIEGLLVVSNSSEETSRLDPPATATDQSLSSTDELSVVRIQAVARGKFARSRVAKMRDSAGPEQEVDEDAVEEHRKQSIVKIQSLSRARIERQRVKLERMRDSALLGLEMPANVEIAQLEQESAKYLEERLEKQHKNQMEYEKAISREKEHIETVAEPNYRLQTHAAFSDWYFKFKEAKGTFPEGLPPIDKFMEQDFSFKNWQEEQDRIEAENAKGKKNKPPPEKGKKGATAEPESYTPPEALQRISAVLKTYKTYWLHQDEDNENYDNRYDENVVRNIFQANMVKRVKEEMYTTLAEELNSVKTADSGKGKKGKDKAAKGGKGSKKDEQTPEEQQEEAAQFYVDLAKADLIRLPVENASLDDELWARVWQSGLSKWAQIPMDQAVNNLVCLYLSSDATTFDGYQRRYSALIVGDINPAWIASVVCARTGSQMVDLSPDVLAAFKEASGNDPLPLLPKAFKFAKATPSTLIVIRNPEKIYAKKSTVTAFETKAYKKELAKQMKGLKPNDRIFVLLLSDNPTEADASAMASAFDFTVYKSSPDYRDRYRLLKSQIAADTGEVSSVLAAVTEGLNSNDLGNVAERFIKSNMKDPRLAMKKALDPYAQLSDASQIETWLSKLAVVNKKE